VFNLPWSLPAPEVEKLFAQFGTVKGVEVSVVSCRVELSNAACRYEKRAFRGLGF
jgi:RNA recognition motif-containing protein